MKSTILSLDVTPRIVAAHPLPAGAVRRAIVAVGALWTIAWVFAVLFLWVAQSQLVFMTGESRLYRGDLDSRIFAERSFPTADGLRLESVQLTHAPAHDRYWILFCPPAGASTRVGRIQEHLRQLWSLGYNVLAFDYRGFGDNAGTPTEVGLYSDASDAYRYLVTHERVPGSRVIVAGRSLGASVAVELATRVEVGGVLLFSPIDSVPDVAARLYPWAPVRRLARYQFDNRSKASAIAQPVVLVYGAPDRFMPLSDARSLFGEFRGPKTLLETNGNHHHSGFTDVPQLYRALSEFWPPEERSTVQ
jgi:pimeloyl-ACP methyl ester carboxylesterase